VVFWEINSLISAELAKDGKACFQAPEAAGLRVESLSFERIPHQTRLFLDYLKDPVALRRFFPNAVQNHHELIGYAATVLANYSTDRERLCSALESMNRGWSAGAETLANIERLRDPACVAAVTGQQAGLFTGPLYTVYKALSAVKLAACLSDRGTPTVPVFWIATEDHDFAEVAAAEIIDCNCQLTQIQIAGSIHRIGQPVGSVVLDNSIRELTAGLKTRLPETEFSDDVLHLLAETWEPGAAFGDAFARMLMRLVGQYGLILLDPRDAVLKEMAAPLYAAAAQRTPEIASALVARSDELVAAGYHAQVLATSDSFPLFWHDGDGARYALTRVGEDRYQTKGHAAEFSLAELTELARTDPMRFSPNVTLRAVVQDHLLPTVAYYGGGAEIAYFAQTAEVYRLLERPATPILLRAGITLVERHTWRTLERYDLSLVDLFGGLEEVLSGVVEKYLDNGTAETFERVELDINRELDELQQQLRTSEPTLADALDNGRKKINYQLHGLRTRFHRAQLNRNGATQRQIEHAFEALYPEKALQERHINIVSLLARHGTYVIQWIYDAANIGSNDHQIVYL
jgi:bacillithiol biosynthesis cysteine-adding enzyme BshC